MGFFDTILFPFKWFVAYLLVTFHKVLTAIGMDSASGWTWGLSIVGLVLVVRALLIPLFVKQIKASRGMATIQPELRKLQQKYKGKTDTLSRQAMAREQSALFKKHNTNPFAACLPILAQMPIFFSLFTVLNGVPKHQAFGPLTKDLVEEFDASSIFGASLSATFLNPLGDNAVSVKVLALVMIVIMCATQFITQKQIMAKNMTKEALEGPFMKQQKILLYLFPLMFAIGGVNFPLGVLIYWLTTNVWTMAQQFVVIRNMPTPGSPAEKAYHARLAAKGKPIPGKPVVVEGEASVEPRGQRQQPPGKKRQKKGPRP